MAKIYRKLVQNRKQINLSADILISPKPQVDLPPMLCNDGTKGVTELVFNVDLRLGVYEFGVQHGVTRNEVDRVSSQAYIVYFDDREIGFGAAPAIDFTEEERDITTDFRCRFICLEEGEHTITVKMIHPWNDFSPNQPFPLALGWKGAFDGFTSETCDYSRSAFFVEITKRLWKYNPGAYQIENRGPNWDRPMTACAPNFMIAQACNHMHWNGYDDKDPIVAYDRKVEHGSLGKNFFLYQADCRMWSPNFFGGNTRPDYVLKQCNDFFPGRAEHPEDMVESAIWWLNESKITGPEEIRRYVYGITQDPVKCAVTCNLGTTGAGGTMDHWHRTDMAEYDGAPRYQTRPRTEVFHDTSIIQNNFFQACFHTNIDGGVLLYDPEGLAHYDSNSLAVPLSKDFLSTVVEGVGKLVRKAQYVEPAGYKAVYEEEAEIQSGGVRERRTVTVHSDTPYLKVLIQRESEIPELGTRIGLEHYDSMTVDGMTYRKAVSLDCPKVMVFADSQGILPELTVLVLKTGQIRKAEWGPGKTLVLQGQEVTQETIELAFAVMEDETPKNTEIDDFLQAMQQDEQEVSFDGKEVIEVSNPHPFPMVRILKIIDPDGSPLPGLRKRLVDVPGSTAESGASGVRLSEGLSPCEGFR